MLKRQKGQGLVEFALISPLLLLVILAIIETALIFQGHLAVQHATREAARWAVTYQPERYLDRDGNECCPNETEEQYYARRVDLIKEVARESAVGLRIDETAGSDEPNYFGVEVWGAMSFFDPDIDASSDQPGLPGLPIRVRVTHNVELLDPIFRAILASMGANSVRVTAQTEMINEGTQAGFGNQPPPALPPSPPLDPLPTPSDDPVVDFSASQYFVGEVQDTATITVVLDAPADQIINVNYSSSDGPGAQGAVEPADYTGGDGLLTFPIGSTSQTFDVTINDDPDPEPNEIVVLTLSGGNATVGTSSPAELIILDNDGDLPVVEFRNAAYSVDEGAGTATIAVELSQTSGQTVTVEYETSDNTAIAGEDYVGVANQLTFLPGITNRSFEVPIIDDFMPEEGEAITLTLDNPVNAVIGEENPAILTILDNEPESPFISSSNYVVTPTQPILLHVSQHPTTSTYQLQWVDDTFSVLQVISPTLEVDASGNKHNISFVVPEDAVAGNYYVETWNSGLVARSPAIQVRPQLADLVVTGINLPDDVMANQEITVTVEVQNQEGRPVTGYSDVDLYVDPAFDPHLGQPGTSKQWIQDLGPGETEVVTHVIVLRGGGAHELWAQVDTSDRVLESDEDNNLMGPLAVNADTGECSELSDRFFDPELDVKWNSATIGNASIHNVSINEEEGTLSIQTNGGGLWGSRDSGSTLLYQSFTGDFVATLKVVQGLSTNQWAKIGLMARASTARNSGLVMVMHTRDNGIQFGYRRPGSGMDRFANDSGNNSVPVWVRLVRKGDSFSAYYSYDGSSWAAGTGNGENGGVQVDLPDTILIGVAASAYSGSTSTGIVDDFEVCPLDSEAESCQLHSDDFDDGFVSDWTDIDIGGATPGSSSEGGGTILVSGNGFGLDNDSDAFHYTYKRVSGNFVATVRVQSPPSGSGSSDARAGLMVRGSTAPGSAFMAVSQRPNDSLRFQYRPLAGDVTRTDTRSSPGSDLWVQIVRNGNSLSAFYANDAAGENWRYFYSREVFLDEEVLVGLLVSAYSGAIDTGEFDDFIFCAGEASSVNPPLPDTDDKPPGLKECVQTIELGDFEATVITPPWERSISAVRQESTHKHAGNYSLRFEADNLTRPPYTHLRPWAYQTVSVPENLLDDTTGVLSYWQRALPRSSSEPDHDDRFWLVVRDSNGVTQTDAIPLAYGDDDIGEFASKTVSVEGYLAGGFSAYAGEDIQLKFYGTHDGELAGTDFIIDDVRFDICTIQPIPPDEPGTASLGGLIEVLLAGVPTKLPGIRVSAYAPGGDLYTTQTIHNSTYHFYNVPPGTYTIYAEVWVGGQLYSGTTEVTVAADERNYSVNLLLQ